MRTAVVFVLGSILPAREVLCREIITVAGGGPRNMPARSARFQRPGVVADGAGNLYIADASWARVFRVDRSGFLTVFAGNGAFAYYGVEDGVPATSTTFDYPDGLALDAEGNLYIADLGTAAIRRVDAATGIITTVVSLSDYHPDAGPGGCPRIFGPTAVAIDSRGNLFISDGFALVCRHDAATGVITLVAGNGALGFGGDGGPAPEASLYYPSGLALDGAGNLFIADGANAHARVRRVDAATGIITTVTGGGESFADGVPATSARLGYAAGVALDGAGDILVADSDAASVRRVDATTGLIATIAGHREYEDSGDGGPATAASLNRPIGVTLDPGGNIFISTLDRVRRIDALTGIIDTAAGGGSGGDGGPATDAGLHTNGFASDAAGDLFLSDDHRIRRVYASTGIIDTIFDNIFGGLAFPGSLALDAAAEKLYFQYERYVLRLNLATGGATAVTGPGYPFGITLDAAGNLFIAETSNRVRRVDATTGISSIVAGNGTADFCGDGGPAIDACIRQPLDVAVDSEGNLFIAETFDGRVRRVDAITGTISTAALAIYPRGLAVDTEGNLFIADQAGAVRRLDAKSGLLTTVAGGGRTLGENGPARSALVRPIDVALDGGGNLLIVDGARVRRVSLADEPPAAVVSTPASIECDAVGGAYVTLDASGSTDPDSTPGTNDDIVAFEWYTDFGTPSQAPLGEGERLSTFLPLGAHAVTLRVIDSLARVDTRTVGVSVVDTTPPDLEVFLDPPVLWPPNHRMVAVSAAPYASDACDPSPTLTLLSAESSEPDDAPGLGDGRTTHDIQGADVGTADIEFLLRAERSATSSGRAYRVTYRATDAAGNAAIASGQVVVPHDRADPVGPPRGRTRSRRAPPAAGGDAPRDRHLPHRSP